MGIDCSYNLIFGFELSEEEVKKKFRKTVSNPGVFHMEDRFDPKTGKKLNPVKVWDNHPSKESYLVIEGYEFNEDYDDDFIYLLSKKFNCHVEHNGNFSSGELVYHFYVNEVLFDDKNITKFGRITIYNDSISLDEINKLEPKALILKNKLESEGFKVPKPRVFLAQRYG
jgi:hypothetical protein